MMLVSCDPGVTGSLVVCDDTGKLTLHDIPIYSVVRKVYTGKRKGKTSTKNHIDIPALRKIFPKGPGKAITEKLGAQPHDGKAQISSLMKGVGIILGFFGAEQFEITEVTPQVWKKAIGIPTGSDKEVSRQLALKLYPEFAEQLARKMDHNRADAILLLHYLRNYVLKETKVKKVK